MSLCSIPTRPSDLHYRRVMLLHEKLLPLMSEMKRDMGEPLAEAFFETCDPVLQKMIGIKPSLEDPGDNFWMSPSDLLLGKVKLKPPFTSKYIKALTHKGILEIGKDIEEKYKRLYERDKERAIEETEEILKYMAEKQKRMAVEEAKKKEREIYDAMIEQLKEEFKMTLEKELDELEKKHQEELVLATELGREEARVQLDNKLEVVMRELFNRLTEQFAEELLKQSVKLHEHFWYHIKQERHKLRSAVEEEKKKCSENISYLRHELHCENISNVIYVVANAKRMHESEKQALEQTYLAQLASLRKELDERNEFICKLLEENAQSDSKILARESLLFELIKQFQKFIYFALKAAPKQAEFLLDVEKLMIFEFTKAVFENAPEAEAEATLEKTTSTASSTSTSNSVLTISCQKYNSEQEIESRSKCSAESDLPAVIFNENLYVREDFRNMLSQGLEISKSNVCWNKDIGRLTEEVIPMSLETDGRFDSEPPSKFVPKPTKSSKTTSVKFSLVEQSKPPTPGPVESSEKFLKALDYDSPISTELLKSRKGRERKEAAPEEVGKCSSGSKQSVTSEDGAGKRRVCVDKKVCSFCESMEAKRTGTVEDILEEILAPVLQRGGVCHRRSTFETHRDSLTLIRESCSQRASVPEVPRKHSRLVDATDSLLLLRSRNSLTQRRSTFKESDTDFLLIPPRRSVGVQYEGLEKSVRYSHIEIIPDDNVRRSTVTFIPKPEVIPADVPPDIVAPAPDTPEGPASPRPSKRSGVEVVGDADFVEQFGAADTFTVNRMNSLAKIFRKNPSLCHLFTQAIKN